MYGAICGLTVSGDPPVVTINGCPDAASVSQALQYATSGTELYTVNDVIALAEHVGRSQDSGAIKALCQIAADTRLLCMTATRLDDGSRAPCLKMRKYSRPLGASALSISSRVHLKLASMLSRNTALTPCSQKRVVRSPMVSRTWLN